MHPIKHPRNAIFIGLIFVATGAVYWALPYFSKAHLDYAGVTMLGVLGIAMAIMFYVLIAGSTD
jgi:uncharacterized membrane protein